jgi:hypothetical protein
VTETLLWGELIEPGPDDGDWSDVVRRAGLARRRRLTSAALVVATVLCVGIAAAYAFGHPIVDFGSAPKGPRSVVNDFGSLQVGAPEGMAPGVRPEEARRITSVTIDGKEHVLWVAPTQKGGFCEQWTNLIAGCRADPDVPYIRRHPLEVSGMYTANPKEGSSLVVIGGSFTQSAAAKLELAYEDGTAVEIPFVWVTAPIDAGFYLFRVPDAHRVDGHRPRAVRLYDDGGHLLASEPASDAGADVPDLQLNLHRVAGYPPLSVPGPAIWNQRRQLFDLRADDGAHIGLWVAPSRTGGTCYWTNQASGCPPPDGESHPPPPLGLGFSGAATHVTLCCTVGRGVAHVEARFEDGDRIELTPSEGYLVWPVPSRHFPRGHRLEELVGFDASGHQIATQRMKPNTAGLYPCSKPKPLGYGVSMCP